MIKANGHYPDEHDHTPIVPTYRGPERTELGVRRTCGPVAVFDWTHDGGPDDIVGYEYYADTR